MKNIEESEENMKIAMLVVPFYDPRLPCIGLTQLKSRVREFCPPQVEIDIFYINHEFVDYFSYNLYNTISNTVAYTALNEWIFREETFDTAENNENAYFDRFYPQTQFNDFKQLIKTKKQGLSSFMTGIIEKYHLDAYDIIGVNATFSILPALAFCRYLKKRNNHIITIMGGSCVRGEIGKAIIENYLYLDYICTGPGLIAFPEFINACIEDKKQPGHEDSKKREHIDGILSFNNIKENSHHAGILPIDHEILLDYDDFLDSFTSLPINKKPVLCLETSRGCSWGKCRFCGLNEEMKKYERKKPEKAVNEINSILNKYNRDLFVIDNVMPRDYFTKVLPSLHVPEGLSITYEVRASLHEKEMKNLSDARVRYIQPGIESLESGILGLMNKGITALDAVCCLRLCSEYGVMPVWNILIGLPFMTEAMYENLCSTISLCYHLFPPVLISPIRYDRYSEYWYEPEKYHVDLHPFSSYEYVYPYDKAVLARIAYHFEDHNYSTMALMVKYMTELSRKVQHWKNRWERRNVNDIPCLYKKINGDDIIVMDTRGENEIIHTITALDNEVLDLLVEPIQKAVIINKLDNAKPDEIERSLDGLQKNNLVMCEDDEYVRLVVNDSDKKLINFYLQQTI
ncbi:MAG: RiPP maturation radical SAM C-methyltransferase [Spirochaetales bacterium]|nr:RiPP maturation radical SAM C-methyltransferase [Spirochaetales bacterium]